MNSRWNLFHVVVCSCLLASAYGLRAQATGSWTPLHNLAPDHINTMLLLTDGTVIAANGDKFWWRLTPDIHGSYINGTWTAMAPMNDSRLYYASTVMPDGRVFVAGGEFGTGKSSAEVYDPLLNTWNLCPGSRQLFSDALCELLPNGNVLVAPTWPSTYGGTIIYNPTLNSWDTRPILYRGFNQDEAAWVKLPDNSILTDDPYGLDATNSERFIPSLNRWINDATIPVSLYNSGDELGAAFLLPNGKAFFLGGGGHTALYTPSGSTSHGTWTAGPNIPDGMGAPDAPAAMMVDGNILCATIGTSGPPTTFYEYNSAANSFIATSSPYSSPNTVQPYYTRMLDLPDGTVLYSDSSKQLYDYQPGGPPLTSGQPVILSITTNFYRSYHLGGILLNGISAGANYGDDAQMDGNYPLVRMTNAIGNVYYARTYNWSSTGVMTGDATNSTDFMVPANLPAGNYSLVVVANGISSAPVPFTFTPDALQLTSLSGFASMGPVGGPFNPASRVYALTNIGAAALDWTALNTSPWLDVSTVSGTLTGGAATNLTVSISPAAESLPVGTYDTTLWLSNDLSHAAQCIPFQLQLFPLVRNGDFESGSFAFWNLSEGSDQSTVGNTGDYSGQTAYIHSGYYGAMLEQSNSLGYLSQTVTTVPGQRYVLSFWLNKLSATPNEFLVTWNGSTLLDEQNLAPFAFTNMHFFVSGVGSLGFLRFAFRDDHNYFGLDDVSLTPIVVPRFVAALQNSDRMAFTWNAMTGLVYQVQTTTDLSQTNWINIGGKVMATNNMMSATEPVGAGAQQFYRVVLSP